MTFEDALADLLATYSDRETEELISTMEIQIMALKEQEQIRLDNENEI